MKKSTEFLDPWPVAWSADVDREVRGALLAAYETACAREREFVDSPKRRRYFARMRALAASAWAVSGDLADAQIDAAHLRLWRRIVRDAEQEGRIPGLMLGDCILATETLGLMAEREGLLDGPSSVNLLCGENEERREYVVSELRALLNDWASVPFRRSPFVDPERSAQWVRWMADDCPDEDLLPLACPPDDGLVGRAMQFVCATSKRPLAIDDGPAGRIAGLRDRRRRLLDEFAAGVKRLDMAATFIRDSFATAIKDHVAADPFAVHAALPALIRIEDRVHGFELPLPGRLPKSPSAILRVIATGEDFWFIVLFQILARHGGVSGDRLADGAPALLDSMLSHPGRLRRLPVKPGLEAARTALARRILPALCGIPSPIGGPAPDDGAAAPAEDVLWRCAFRIATAHARALSAADKADERADGIRALFAEWIAPFPDEIVAFFRRCHELGMRPDEDPDVAACAELRRGQIPPEPGPDEGEDMDGGESAALPSAMPAWFEEEAPVAEPETPPVRAWFYVREPGNPASSLTEVVLDPDSLEADLGAFMRHEGIPTVVKPSSVLHAIDHYLDLPDDVRAVLPHEVIGTMSWPKLKRGRLRILLRRDGDRLLFHIYARRDWAYRGPD